MKFQMSAIRTLARVGLAAATLSSWNESAWAQAAAAFIQPDLTTGLQPYGSLKVIRGGVVIDSLLPLRPCDSLEFISRPGGATQVNVSTVKSGKNIVLSADRSSATVPCSDVRLGDAATKVWWAISGGERTPESRKAGSGRGQFEFPVFALGSTLLLSGKRSLYVTWSGGKPPYRLRLLRSATGEVLADLAELTALSAWLPPSVFIPGEMYSLIVFNSQRDGLPGLRADIPALGKELPPMPSLLRSSSLSRDEMQYLYALYLEGLEDGKWTFEAMQIVAPLRDRLPAAADWLASFGD